MLRSTVLCALVATSAYAHPVISKRQMDIDTTILQFALTLEHLENSFYKTALGMLTQQHFMDAGFGPNYFNNIQLIAQDEDSHVKFLSDALTAAGAQPVQPCTYNFAMTDVMSFITLSNVLEGVGTSAYLGGAPLITSKDILTAAGSILVTEALHTSLQRSALNAVPGANPFGTPLDPNAVFTLAASFITACPASNAALPFTSFPALISKDPACFCEGPDCSAAFFQKRQLPSPAPAVPSQCTAVLSKTIRTPEDCIANGAVAAAAPPVANGNAIGGGATLCRPPAPGSTVTFTAASAVPAGSFVTFISGLMIVSVPAQGSDNMVTATIPDGISGQSYVLITSADAQGTFDATTVLFGPAVLEVHPAAPLTGQAMSAAAVHKQGASNAPPAAANGTSGAAHSTMATVHTMPTALSAITPVAAKTTAVAVHSTTIDAVIETAVAAAGRNASASY